ncbi:MAG: hypothetical protein QGH20_03850 [Candidatus Latescibacteria bacterium]|nr:hypothetical protein [Candidatus Latescibacterota bacterium]
MATLDSFSLLRICADGRWSHTPGGAPLTPAIVLSDGTDITQTWEIVPIMPVGSRLNDKPLPYPESTVIVDATRLTAFVRNNPGFVVDNWQIKKASGFRFLPSPRE